MNRPSSSGEDAARTSQSTPLPASAGGHELSSGQRIFRRGLHIVIALLLTGTAIVVALELLRGSS